VKMVVYKVAVEGHRMQPNVADAVVRARGLSVIICPRLLSYASSTAHPT
jgi:hypothetical protein